MRLARYGMREMVLLTLVLGAAALAAATVHAALPVLIGIGWLGVLAFFRDPHRPVPDEPAVLVAPADGRVTEVTHVAHDEWIGGPATRIGIFLSVLDVHVNRSPCGGRVVRADYQPGEFLDARHRESGRRNECNTLVIDPEPGLPRPVVVRQVAGKIARRIVCTVRSGDALRRGQRIGMIKFGSRAEVIVPRHIGTRIRVGVGDRVTGASTVLVQYRPAQTDDQDVDQVGPEDRLAHAAAS